MKFISLKNIFINDLKVCRAVGWRHIMFSRINSNKHINKTPSNTRRDVCLVA